MEPPPIQYVRTGDGFDIAYTVCGEGPLLVYLPVPFNNVRERWKSLTHRPWLEALGARFQLVTYDGRGQGMSTRGLPQDIGLHHYELDLQAVMSQFPREAAVLYGLGPWAHVAVRYAVHSPERVSALVLSTTNLDDPLGGVRYLEGFAKESWENFLKMPAYVAYRQDPPARAHAILKDSMSQEDFFVHMRLAATSLKPLLSLIQAPTLVLATGEEVAPIGGEEEAKRIAALIPNSRLVLFDGTSGAVMAQGGEPPAFVQAVEQLLGDVRDHSPAPRFSPALKQLSPRETDVLRLIAQGRSNLQIADELVLSVRTVERHITNLYAKIGAHGKADATAYALRNGLA